MTTTTEPASTPEPPRPRRRRATRGTVLALVVCGLAVVAIVVLAIQLSGNVVYFRTVSEAVRDRSSQGTSRFRLAGAVVPGSIAETPNGVRFRVTDGNKTVTVVHRGDPPELFKNGAPVVCEGRWASTATTADFDSDRIMIKHGEEYTPPKVDTNKATTTSAPGIAG